MANNKNNNTNYSNYINYNSFNYDNDDKGKVDPNNGGKKTGLVILAAVVFIVLLLMLIIVIVFRPNSGQRQIVANEYNEVVANIITQEVTNDPIIDNPEESFDRRYGKVDVIFLDKNDNIIDIPSKPVVGDMKPVKFDERNKEFIDVEEKDPTWYDYANRKWANAINSDGSYFVWIPRFAYKITYYSSSSYSKAIGYSDARGLIKINTTNDGQTSLTRIQTNSSSIKEIGNHYILAPAFMRDALNNYENGGWDVNLSGFWVAKYEMSMEQNGKNVLTDSTNGNVKISNDIKAVSKPGVNSWRCISIGNAYYNGINYDKSKQSHMVKNSEWAAVGYLANSQYGTNGEAILKNSNPSFYTGGAENKFEIYYTNNKQSTTWNYTGVYDLSGGAREFSPSFVDNGFNYIAEYGGTDTDMLYENNMSTKFKTVYPHVVEDIGQTGTFSADLANGNYGLLANRRGDAMYEVSNNGFGVTGWFTSHSYMVQSDVPFLLRGTSAMDSIGSGTFAFNTTIGQANTSDGYRVCLVTE